MSLDTVREVVEKRFNDNWTSTPIQWENVHFEPQDGQAFIAPVIVPTSGDQVSLGTVALNRWDGFVDVSIFVPRGIGAKLANDLSNEVIKLFYHYTDSGVSFFTGYSKPTGATEIWFRVNVTVPYQFDELI